MRRAVTRVVVGLAVVAAALTAASCGSVTDRGPSAMTGTIVARGNAALELSEQQGTKDIVLIRRILVPADSWVVVTASGVSGTGARRVGVAHVGPGESRDLSVALALGSTSSQRLTVVLHVDRGMVGRFEFDAARFETSPDKPYFIDGTELSRVVPDAPVTSIAEASGAGVASDIAARSGTVALEVSSRLMVFSGMVIDRVLAPGPAWVVVYLVGTDGRPSGRAGIVAVPPGKSEGVTVSIDADVVLTPRVLVVLHSDAGAPGRLEFDPADFEGSPDRPYSVGGAECSTGVGLRNYGLTDEDDSGM